MTKLNKNYEINFMNNTVTVTKKFNQIATTDITSEEFKQMMQFRQMGLEVVIKSANHKGNHRATYKQMKTYISCVADGERYLQEFEVVRLASLKDANPYKTVCDWFKKTFPNHKALPELDENGKIINFADTSEETDEAA